MQHFKLSIFSNRLQGSRLSECPVRRSEAVLSIVALLNFSRATSECRVHLSICVVFENININRIYMFNIDVYNISIFLV